MTMAEGALMVSSDGHATAQMREYRSYLDPGIREEFDAFRERFDDEGMTTINPKSLANRIDPKRVAQWVETVLDEGRQRGHIAVRAGFARRMGRPHIMAAGN
jgi:hypothetical protein